MIFLNVGSSLDSFNGNRFFNLKKTLELIKLENIKISKISSIYETPSYPNQKNPKFLIFNSSILFLKLYNLSPLEESKFEPILI